MNIPMDRVPEKKNTRSPQQLPASPQHKVASARKSVKTQPTLGKKPVSTKHSSAKKGVKSSASPAANSTSPKNMPRPGIKKPSSSRIYLFDRFYQKLPFSKRLNARWHLALDLDPDKIRYVVMRKSGVDIQVVKWGIQKFPSEESDRRKALQIALENVKAKVYVRGMDITANLFSPEVTIRQINFPKIKNVKDLKQAIFNKNLEELKNFNEKSIWNYEILDEFTEEDIEKYRLLVVTVPDEVISYYIQVFNNAKLELKYLIPRPAALLGAYRRMVFRPDRELLIDIGYNLTQMCYIKNGELQVIRNVSIGARNLEVSIRDQNLKLDSKPDEEDKSNPDFKKPVELRSRLLNKIKDLKNRQNPVLHTFFSEVLRSLAYIQGRNVQQYIERIFVTGYGVRKESLLPYLRSRLSMPMFVLAPQFENADRRSIEYSEYFSSLGTALQDRPVFNLLPSSYKTRFVFKKINYLLATILVILVLVLGYFSFREKTLILQKENLVQKYKKEYKNLNPIELKYKDVLKQITIINQKNQELRSYVKTKPFIIQVLRLFSNETPRNMRLNKIQFIKLLSAGNGAQKSDNAFHNDYSYQIDIEGVIQIDPLMGDVTLINYINHLKELNYFKHMELLNKFKDPEQNITRFGLRLYL